MAEATVIAVLGAESTGKSTLALALQAALAAEGRRVAGVGEVLREFCDAQGRTPRQHEQASIAAEQTRRIDAAATDHDIVIADTTALQIAVYSEMVFGDRSLYDEALRAQARCWHTLLCALDLPWVADGLQRDGPQVREPVDTLLRAALRRHGPGFSLVSGRGTARTEAALAAVRRGRVAASAQPIAAGAATWRHVCVRCGDPDCEQPLLPGALLSRQ
jgi:nicotinamide riboside kinase